MDKLYSDGTTINFKEIKVLIVEAPSKEIQLVIVEGKDAV
jgi:hypothetical protein